MSYWRSSRHFLILTCAVVGLLRPGAAPLAAAAPGDPGLPPTNFTGLAPKSAASLAPYYSETGLVSLSIDALGTVGSSGVIRADKPASGSVSRAFLMAASAGYTSAPIPDGTMTLAGVPIVWSATVANSIGSQNHIADVTSIVKPILDAAPAGLSDLTVGEGGISGNIDGSILAVIFSAPEQTRPHTAVIFFGAQNIAGDAFAIGLSEPAQPLSPEYVLNFSLGISYGFQGVDSNQSSLIEVNGLRLTSAAGGQDDGTGSNGALITAGGIGDSNTNPRDPNSGPSRDPRQDDEYYNLKPFVRTGDSLINVYTINRSFDDNILFAALLVSGGAVVGEGALLTPNRTVVELGTTHTVTATLQDDAGVRLAGRNVHFEVISGPGAGAAFDQPTDAGGQAAFTYAGALIGADAIRASFVNFAGQTQHSNTVFCEWIPRPAPPGCVWTDATTGPLDNSGLDGHGVAWGDLDGDGDDDLYLANNGKNKLLRNENGGVFTEVAHGDGEATYDSRGAAWGDYDNDGDLDLYVVNWNGPNVLYRNDGGALVAATAGDLACPLQGNNAAWADYDKDGDLDLFVTNYDGPNKLLNNDGGVFTSVASAAGFTDLSRGCAWGDYDNDRDPDLYVSVQDGPNHLFRNDGGVLVDVTVAPLDDRGKGKGVAWGDYDNDGDLDLYLVNRFTANRLFVNDGGVFTISPDVATAGAGDGRACGWGDYNNDGWLDLYVTNCSGDSKLFHNLRGEAFADSTCGDLQTPVTAWGMGWNDYDGDGDLDLYVSNHNYEGLDSRLFRNDLITDNSWLRVELQGVISNRAGIGARIVATDPVTGQAQMREITAGSGYMSQQAAVAQFGLSDANRVDLTIQWPSGLVQTATNQPVDRRIVIAEAAEVSSDEDVRKPLAYNVQNHPNPFNPLTTIEFSLPVAGAVTLCVYDVDGRLVKTLLSETAYAGGTFSVDWNGTTNDGRKVASGVYLYRFTAGAYDRTGRMVLMK